MEGQWYSYHSTTGFKTFNYFEGAAHRLLFKKDELWLTNVNKIFAYDYKSNQKTYEFSYQGGNHLKLINNYDGDRILFWRFNGDEKIEILEVKNNKLERIAEIITNNPHKRCPPSLEIIQSLQEILCFY